jgi:hypothetical protein
VFVCVYVTSVPRLLIYIMLAICSKYSLLPFPGAALFLTVLVSLLLKDVSALLTSLDCRWPDGTDSNGQIPCNPDAERSACCFGSEVCLENNLCFGGVSLIYRGSCAGGWGDNLTCPEFCNDISRKCCHPCPGPDPGG